MLRTSIDKIIAVAEKYLQISVYLGSKLLFKQILLKTMEHCLLFLILFFQVSLLFFLCQDLDGKGIVPYLLPKHFWRYGIIPLSSRSWHKKNNKETWKNKI